MNMIELVGSIRIFDKATLAIAEYILNSSLKCIRS